jgi:hypothetical protein
MFKAPNVRTIGAGKAGWPSWWVSQDLAGPSPLWILERVVKPRLGNTLQAGDEGLQGQPGKAIQHTEGTYQCRQNLS